MNQILSLKAIVKMMIHEVILWQAFNISKRSLTKQELGWKEAQKNEELKKPCCLLE